MEEVTRFLHDNLKISPDHQTKLLYSLLILVIFWIIRFGVLKLVWRLTEDPKTRYTWKRTVSFTVGFLILILIAAVWIDAISQFGAFLGLLTAGLAIALKDPLTNIAGWIFILTRKPFTLGDRIQIGEHKGDVIDIRLFQFTILEIGNWVNAEQSTGRIIHLPNGTIFTTSQANYTTGFKYIWNEISVLVTFESQWELAKKISARPAAYTSYQRMAFEPPHHHFYRVTFDRNIRAGEFKRELSIANMSAWPRVPIDGVVLELKFTDLFPDWMHELAQIFNLQRISVPKYVECLNTIERAAARRRQSLPRILVDCPLRIVAQTGEQGPC